MKLLKTLTLTAALAAASTSTLAASQISASQAASIAAKHIGGQATDVDFERKRSGNYYEVEVKKTNGQEYDVRIDATTGKVLRAHADDDNAKRSHFKSDNAEKHAKADKQGKSAKAAISAEQAADIAAKHVGGRATDVEFERKRTGNFYDVEVKKADGTEYKVRVHAKTGKVLRAQLDD
ncbi:hypothetical protein B0181_00560 [Moraxella caviae]|uniref:Peptidase propeptide and YPEB domain n=1 Tax=Moraxella caviae TaxID=34060 RepID=A0A1T0ABV9_9GAMM|nr:PepSY domain-containing protein [Moraxella caviae]OOR93170.1 hypothetical protein B0181_00560 [Moraxella caviae]STZ10438.1 Peptidase propeptide and YPEB domain [Moraxella caviae]VEW11729.1 Peptidase propeptide and YPEB domain [Moraxella caviae]